MKKIGILLTCIVLALLSFPLEKCEATQMISKPQVNVSEYWLDHEKVVLGDDNSVHLVLSNFSGEYPVTDVMVSFVSDNNTVVPVYGKSNQFFIDTIEAQGNKSVDIPISIVYQENGYASMSLLIEYCINGEVFVNDLAYIVIPVDYAEKFKVENINVSSTAQVNSKVFLVVNYENVGEAKIQDVYMTIQSEDFQQDVDLLVKDLLAAGEEGCFEHYLSFATPGNKKIALELRYVDESGNEYIKNCGEYSILVTEEVNATGQENSDKDTEDGLQTGDDKTIKTEDDSIAVYVVMGIAAAIAVVCLLIGIFKPKRRGK